MATVTTRWFEHRRGLVTGVLTAASATGQPLSLPVVAALCASIRKAQFTGPEKVRVDTSALL
ncbi:MULTISPECIES: hypothetical protein [unclassified Mycolicibacterium]|uniref:hypothetical protein n=1 Tax=unclassified Mycolicibacterium TaxID=2636767 RepID=UPI0035CAEA3F